MIRTVINFILVLFVLFHAVPAYALFTEAYNTLNKAGDRVHQKFVEAKWVENIRKLNQNLQESKAYYDYMKSVSSHRGGISGYVKDRVTKDLERVNNKLYWDIESHMKSDPEETAYVRKWMTDLDKKISTKLGFSKEIHDNGANRDEDLKGITKQATKQNPTVEEVNQMNRRAMVMQLELLSDINKQLTQLYLAQMESERAQALNMRRSDIAEQRSKEYFSKMMTEAGKKTPKKDPLRVLGEVPR